MYKYIGNSWIHGIPARDIPEDEFRGMTKEQQEAIKNSPLYKLDRKEKKSEVTQEN